LRSVSWVHWARFNSEVAKLQGGSYCETDHEAGERRYRAYDNSADGNGLRRYREDILRQSSAETNRCTIHGAGTGQDRHRTLRGSATGKESTRSADPFVGRCDLLQCDG